MKPIEYREIDNPASLLKKLNEIVDALNQAVHGREPVIGLIDILSSRVGGLEAGLTALSAVLYTAAEILPRATDRTQATTKDDKNINT